jgi:hypothetical protein
MRVKTDNRFSKWGEHCGICGSLVEVCIDKNKCAEEAALYIDQAIISGDTDGDYLLDKAFEMMYPGEKTAETFVGKLKRK